MDLAMSASEHVKLGNWGVLQRSAAGAGVTLDSRIASGARAGASTRLHPPWAYPWCPSCCTSSSSLPVQHTGMTDSPASTTLNVLPPRMARIFCWTDRVLVLGPDLAEVLAPRSQRVDLSTESDGPPLQLPRNARSKRRPPLPLTFLWTRLRSVLGGYANAYCLPRRARARRSVLDKLVCLHAPLSPMTRFGSKHSSAVLFSWPYQAPSGCAYQTRGRISPRPMRGRVGPTPACAPSSKGQATSCNTGRATPASFSKGTNHTMRLLATRCI